MKRFSFLDGVAITFVGVVALVGLIQLRPIDAGAQAMQSAGSLNAGGLVCSNGTCTADQFVANTGFTGGAFSGTTGAFSGTITSTVASGSNSISMLNGARIKLSDSNANGVLSYNSSQSEATFGVGVNATLLELSTPGSGYQLTAVSSCTDSNPCIRSAVNMGVNTSKSFVSAITDNSGTPTNGTTTINNRRGRAAMATGGSTITVSNNVVTAGAYIGIQQETADVTCIKMQASSIGSGTFTVTCYSAANVATAPTANTTFRFLVED